MSGRPCAHRPRRHSRRSFAAYYRRVDDALRHHADGHRLLESPLVGLHGVQRLARRQFRRSAFADVHATERAAAMLTPRQVLALQLSCDGQPMSVIAERLGLRRRQHHGAAYRRPAAEAGAPRVPSAGAGGICPELE